MKQLLEAIFLFLHGVHSRKSTAAGGTALGCESRRSLCSLRCAESPSVAPAFPGCRWPAGDDLRSGLALAQLLFSSVAQLPCRERSILASLAAPPLAAAARQHQSCQVRP